jgi:large subunit ribosomal protein L32e
MVTVRGHKKVVKKTNKTFRRWNAHSRIRLSGDKWRRPRGIDNRQRRHYRGTGSAPGVGYGKDSKTKYMERSGFIKFVVHNVKELELLMMHNRKYAAVVAHNVGAKTRKLLVARADELDIKVLNRQARIKSEETQ